MGVSPAASTGLAKMELVIPSALEPRRVSQKPFPSQDDESGMVLWIEKSSPTLLMNQRFINRGQWGAGAGGS